MRIIPDQLNSKNLVPFRKRRGRYKIPGMAVENQVSMDRVDPDLSQEEQTYVRHFLGYADAFIRAAEDNAFAEPGAADSQDNALPSAAEQPAASLADESTTAESHRPARAA
jgi:hypothetical protein